MVHGTVTCVLSCADCFVIFFFNDPATTEIYTLSLHDALPIYGEAVLQSVEGQAGPSATGKVYVPQLIIGDRKSTRLNSSHVSISYAVFCLKKKKNQLHFHLPILALPRRHRKSHAS